MARYFYVNELSPVIGSMLDGHVVGKAGAFTTQEMERLEGYAAHLLSIAGSLTAAHVYRHTPPLQVITQY